MLKELTLADAWKHCLVMWKWISEQDGLSARDIVPAKKLWLNENGFGHIEAHCFFCHYHSTHRGHYEEIACAKCPAVLATGKPWTCQPGVNTTYDGADYYNPVEFYAELKRVHALYLETL